MGDIFADGGTSGYPTSLDTATTQANVGSPPYATTSTHAQKINNLATAIIAVETEIGVVPGTNALKRLNHGECRLTKSGSNLLLSRFNGSWIVINGTSRQIPSSGPTLSTSGLSASTLYYIYVFMNGSTMTLEASTTANVADTAAGNEGVEIKTGDATRSLVGLARTTSGTAWADSATQMFVLSYFNRGSKVGRKNFTANRTTTSTSYVELNSEIRVEFLTWDNEKVDLALGGWAYADTVAVAIRSVINVDDESTLTDYGVWISTQFVASNAIPLTLMNQRLLAKGYHYATIFGNVEAGQGTWVGGAAGGTNALTALSVGIRG